MTHTRTCLFPGLVLAAAAAMIGCTHTVKVEPIKVEPIDITLHIYLEADKKLDAFFSDVQPAPTPAGEGATPPATVPGKTEASPIVKRFTLILMALVMLVYVPAPVQAQTKAELKAQFKARATDLHELKRNGRVGETIDGYVEVVDAKAPADSKVAALVSDENRDRRKLYQILADEINKEEPNAKVKATVETIAARNAVRNIEHPDKDEYLRVAKDHWIKAKDYPRFEKLSRLKAQGKVGETAGGMVEIVQAADRADTTIASVVNDENASRTAEYKALADKERVDVAAIAKRMAKRNFDNARVGDMLKEENGTWRKK